MPVSTLSCPPCRKAKKKARKRKIAATDVDNDEASESLLLEVFWLDRLTQYSKSALAFHRETCDLLNLDYEEPDDVHGVLEQIQGNRALVGPKVEACASISSLAASHYFSSKLSSTYYAYKGEEEYLWFIGETETTFSEPRPYQQASLALYALRVQESRLLQDSSLLSEGSELSAYSQKYSEVVHYLRSAETWAMPPLPWTHNLLSLIEVREQRRKLISNLQATGEKDMFGRSLLHLALDLGVGDDAVHLLSSVANEPDAWGRLPLHIASFTGCIDLTTRLIYDKTKIQLKDHCDLQPLHYASAAGHVDIVNLLIGKAEIDPEDGYCWTPLIYGAINGHVTTATVLLENGADIEFRDVWDWTPLLFAINGGRVGIVDLLLHKGAQVKPMMKTRKSMSHPLKERHLGVIKLLLEHGAVKEIRRFSNENLLLWAAEKQDHRLCGQLILHKVFRRPISTNGVTALSYASEEGNLEIVMELLEDGVDPNERCSGRELPLSYAVAQGHVSVTKELLKHDANPNAKSGIDMEGQMILAKAFELRYPDIIDHLVAWGADVSAVMAERAIM
ncbi:serine threonine phosphatase 6 regulatory ankyrin repeat subunit A [Fusarium pseudocircinatum]|uniref:Serine threonine phosphatase 6 regulatory ankyrin repeat subunit A n=1 Tax=Fusarium pseudocircinatum TaxID=56676 RepID=A0A8H5KL36_9HYPO|nr:serine threonine phosphatase 6 regulatory ankyrin repeat subunit A [Fusarium pseudocircinatum]